LSSEEDWFSGIERVLMMNGLAEMSSNLALLMTGEDYHDWKVTYNRRNV
jgi:hypothetical protein